MEGGGLCRTLILPRGDIGVMLIVAKGFAFRGLVLFAEVAATGFLAIEGVEAHKFSEFEEVRDATGFFQGLVEFFAGAENANTLPKFFTKRRNQAERLLESSFIARHAAVIPHNFAEFAVEGVDGAIAIAVEQLIRDGGDMGYGFFRSRDVGGNFGRLGVGEVIADGVRNDEVAVRKTLHECAGAETIGAMIGEISFAQDKEAGNGRHQVVIDPQAAHGVVRWRDRCAWGLRRDSRR